MDIGGKIPPMRTPQQVILIAIEPKTEADREKLAQALRQLLAEDPTFGMNSDVRTGQSILRGVNELQLEIIVDRLKCEFNIDVTVGNPQVAYKETVTQLAEGEGRYVRQTGSRGHYAHAKIRLVPGNPGSGYVFDSQSIEGMIPKEFIPSIDEGIKEALTRGVLTGYPIDDVRVELYEGSYHEVDSSESAFKVAGAEAFRDAAKKANPVLLEPVMATEVVVPEEYLGDVVGDLTSRRGRIESVERRGTTQAIKSLVPLSELLGYAKDLRARTQSRATCSIYFDRYAPVSGGPHSDNEDRIAPVVVPRTPMPKSKSSGVALPEPECE
jgi:elongation factor G